VAARNRIITNPVAPNLHLNHEPKDLKLSYADRQPLPNAPQPIKTRSHLHLK
jgi:hypothetical protein